jgi:hypothetical protein
MPIKLRNGPSPLRSVTTSRKVPQGHEDKNSSRASLFTFASVTRHVVLNTWCAPQEATMTSFITASSTPVPRTVTYRMRDRLAVSRSLLGDPAQIRQEARARTRADVGFWGLRRMFFSNRGLPLGDREAADRYGADHCTRLAAKRSFKVEHISAGSMAVCLRPAGDYRCYWTRREMLSDFPEKPAT